jgi:hypothetical protein
MGSSRRRGHRHRRAAALQDPHALLALLFRGGDEVEGCGCSCWRRGEHPEDGGEGGGGAPRLRCADVFVPAAAPMSWPPRRRPAVACAHRGEGGVAAGLREQGRSGRGGGARARQGRRGARPAGEGGAAAQWVGGWVGEIKGEEADEWDLRGGSWYEGRWVQKTVV